MTEDISPLFSRDLEPRAVWAVRDNAVDVNLDRLKASFPDVRFAEDAQSINSGVLLMNLPLWRSERIAEQTIEVLWNSPEQCVWKNQDALNVALAGGWGLLTDKWNDRLRGYT